METLIKIIQVLSALSLLVLVHEFGHFFFARLFKIRVEKFYLFFNPGFTLFKFKPKNSDTEYGLGWLPLGGYCKISGMIDESMDRESMSQPPQPWEFRSKPAWQRFFVMFGGVFFNFILAILIYSGTLYAWGEQYLKNSEAIYGVECSPLAIEMGFKDGDRVLSFDGEEVDKFHELQIVLARNQAESAEVIREGERVRIEIDQKLLPEVLRSPGMFSLRVPFQIAEIPDSSINSGLFLPKDRVLSINSISATTIDEIKPLLERYSGERVPISLLREGNIIEDSLSITSEGLAEVLLEGDLSQLFNLTQESFSLLSSLPAGVNKATTTIRNYFKELSLIFSPKTEAYKSVGSFIAIGKIFPSTWVWEIFWNITAWLSIMLAVINLLPIPALDGGHILFLLYEIVSGRKPNDKVLEYAQVVGMLILFAIMFLAFGNDIYRLFK